MDNVLTNVTLTDNQKALLVRIQSAATPLLAGKEVRNGRASMEAAKMLIDLGILKYSNEETEITELGKQKMKDENIIDDTEQLTPYGNSLKQQPSNGNMTAPPPPPQPSDDKGGDNGLEMPSLESFQLLKDLNNRITLTE